nr:hypothetical protein BaRGS_025274 [Batillaria attramentaria]
MSAAAKEASTSEKLTPKSGGDAKARDIDIIRKNLAKRSFHVKFDLDNTDYQPIEKIGIGAYGVVCSAVNKKTNEKVAIKKIPCVFEALDIAKRTYREIKILRHFKHDNIISIQEILKPKETYHEFRDIYVVFDLMESDLHRIIYSEQPLTEEHIRYFLYQILRGLKYIHSANVVHRDLKPSNLLVNEDCHVRIGDFGMARGVNSQREEPSHYMTQYVATRWYRAPEILLSLLEYGTAVDMWSVGCIFAEMLGRKHLFPGKDYLSQVKLVLGLLGTPSDVVIKQCQNDVLRRIIKSLGHRQALPWTTLFPKASKKAIDLLSKMLVINPADRITVQRALQHPFLSKYHDPDDEPICVPSFEFDFEKELFHMDRTRLREVIYKEVMDFHQPRTPTLSFSACLRPAPKSGEGSAEAPFSPSFKDQLQSYMSDLTQAASTPSKEHQETDYGVQPSFHQSGITPHTEAVSTTSVTTTQDQKEVFKTPADKPASKKSPVSVETAGLQLPCTSDIEMLSAQSTASNREMDVQTPRTPLVEKQQETEKEKKQGEKKAPEGKTISEDTKALVKQALLSHRQRTESCGEDDKPRPVTAAQRQREREEKRRKKKDREKMKKVHEKKNAGQGQELSDADKELLARWNAMQKVKNAAESQQPASTVTSASTGLATQGQVTIMQGQVTRASQGQGTASQQDGQSSQAGIPSMPPNQISVSFQGQDQMGLANKIDAASGQHFQASFLTEQVLSLVNAGQHPGTVLQISSIQAEALKQALKLQSLSIVQPAASSTSGPNADQTRYQQVPTPPQVMGDVNQGQSGKLVVGGQSVVGGPSQSHQTFPSSDTNASSYNQAGVSQHKFAHADNQNDQKRGSDAMFSLQTRKESPFDQSRRLVKGGTGGGYGVGMDLDVLMADTLDNSSTRNELSPLSSSLLADWLEMTGNISQADLDALEQDFSMTSPVAMSYPEFQPPSTEGGW